MKYESSLIVVKDIDASVKFYNDVLGLDVICDFGANKTLAGGISLQTLETWLKFIHKEQNDIIFSSNSMELYFEEEDLDCFVEKLNAFIHIKYVHKLEESSWGQRTVRFYDPDNHIIEVGESMKSVVKRFFSRGMTAMQIAQIMKSELSYVTDLLK